MLVGLIAWAATNPLAVLTASVVDTTLSISTTPGTWLDKGWFSVKNVFDRSKTDLRITYTMGPTACSGVKPGDPLSSLDLSVGVFTAVRNANDNNVIGYLYNTTVDLEGFANHWNLHISCDGTTHIDGCDQAQPVSVTVEAWDNRANPPVQRTYDVNGTPTNVEVTLDAGLLAAIQDPTVTDSCLNCGIGTCTSACEAQCPKGKNGNVDQKCARACECPCQLQKYLETNGACHPEAPKNCAD